MVLGWLLVEASGSALASSEVEHATSFATQDRDESRRRFWVVVDRAPSDGRLLELIHRAEEIEPSREEVLARLQREREANGGWFLLPDPAHGDPLWSVRAFDGVRAADSVTSEAIAYYVDTIDALRDDPRAAKVRLKRAGLLYAARAAHHDRFEIEGEDGESVTFTDVDVVVLGLDWRQHCGRLCAMGFSATRTVVFDAGGNVLRVFGDGHRNH